MKKLIVIVLALAMVLGFAACGEHNTPQPPKEPEKISLKLSVDEFPVIDGALACLPYYENTAALVLDMDIEDARQYVLANNTPASFAEIAESSVDMIFCLHGSDDQEENSRQNGVELIYDPFALDAFVFFVNKDNPVDSISMEQLHDIYAGKISNWKELGGKDEAIIAYQRNNGSGSQTGLLQYVISEEDLVEPPTEQRIGAMGTIVDAVADYDNASGALGYSYLYFVSNQHFDEKIKLLKVNGVEPNAANIQSREYPMVTEYCCVTSNKSSESAKKLVEWCLSDQGQKLAAELSYVPVRSIEK